MTGGNATMICSLNRPRTACDGRGHGTGGSAPMQDQPNVPYGYCHCGCGQKTRVADETDRSKGWVNGRPMRYLVGHNRAKRRPVSPVLYIVDPKTGCWIWQRSKNPDGYGQIRIDRKLRPAHRVMYERFVGPVPAELDMDHLCRTPSCVNPAHLEPVTRTVNSHRGQGVKLSMEVAREIRTAYANGTSRPELARRYGVQWCTINNVVIGKTWKV